jgi:hypothetical protein
MLRRVVWQILIDVSKTLAASSMRAMRPHPDDGGSSLSSSVTSISVYQITRTSAPEDSHLHACRPQNLESHMSVCLST